MTSEFTARIRGLRTAVEPVSAGVYFAPEALAVYEALGFDGGPAVDNDGVARPELRSYFTSRGACIGEVPGEVVATVSNIGAGPHFGSGLAIDTATEQCQQKA